mgnify:CR=1 FL=1
MDSSWLDDVLDAGQEDVQLTGLVADLMVRNTRFAAWFNGKGKARHFWDAEIYESELVPKLDAFLKGELTEERSRFPSAPGKTYDD